MEDFSSKSLAVIATGGTIAMAPSSKERPSPVLSAEKLLQGIPLGAGKLSCYAPYNLGSEDVTFSHWISLAAAAKEALASHDSVIVLHGTDTMSEAAFFLAETLGNPDIVLTGSMRTSGQLGFDGRSNIQNAATLALLNLELGVCVCMDSQVLPAWSVTKEETVRIGSFGPGQGARIGQVHDGQLRLASAPLEANWIGQLPQNIDSGKVGIVSLAADPSPHQIEAVLAASEAVVLEALATGHIPQAVSGILLEAAKSMPVVMTSRVARGPVEASHTYPGVWDRMRSQGIIIEPLLDTYKARVRLAVSLALGQDYQPFELRLP